MDIPPAPALAEIPQSHSARENKIYRAGTLRYTLRGLFILFLWLLCGDFAFAFFEAIYARFIPLYLRDLSASNTMIGVMTGSIAGSLNVLFLPNISQWSDRFRSRRGRRMPFLFLATPLTVASLVLMGFAPEIGDWLHGHVLAHFLHQVSRTTVVLTLLCAFAVSYHFFNMILVNAYQWLLRDVVPEELMGRFLSWFRIVSSLGTFFFLWFVFPHVVTCRREVCTGVGLFYLISFLLMCRNVREGEYPAPPPPRSGLGETLRSYVRYFRHSLGIPLYRNFFLTYVLVLAATSSATPFSVLFARNTLGLDMEDLGKIFAIGTAVSALVYFPVGWLCDKFTPLPVVLASIGGFILLSISAWFLVHDRTTLIIYTVVFSVPTVGWWLGSVTTTMKLFPSERFGEFASGLSVFGCGSHILGNFLIGRFMDFVDSNYRMIFLWSALFFVLAIIPMMLVHRGWKRHGGRHHYVPPLPA